MKELEDHSWFPSTFRNYQTEYIGFVVTRFKAYDEFVKYLNNLSLPQSTMTDLCSGSGEPAISIFKHCNCFTQLTLTDKFPCNLKMTEDTISYEMESIDAMEMSFKSGTCYTIFNAFHHFSDEEKLLIVQNIKASGSSAFIVELLEPTVPCLLKIVFTTTIGCLLLTPFIYPLSISRLFFTYVFPINLITITFDGVVSVLKSRSENQYQKLFVDESKFLKTIRLKSRFTTLTILQIVPA